CILWLAVFVTRHTPYRRYFAAMTSKPLKYTAALLIIVYLLLFIFLFISVIRSLVLDSRISFDVSHFYAINIYTILGLLVIGGITAISCLVIYLFNCQFNTLLGNKKAKYFLVGAIGIIMV